MSISAKSVIRMGSLNSAPPRPMRPPRVLTAAPAKKASNGRRTEYALSKHGYLPSRTRFSDSTTQGSGGEQAEVRAI